MNSTLTEPSMGLTVAEASQHLRLGRNRTFQLLHSGRLRGVRVGRRWIVPRRALEEFLERQSDEGGE